MNLPESQSPSNIKRLLISSLKRCYRKIKFNVCACLIRIQTSSPPYLPYLDDQGKREDKSLTHHLSPSTMYKMPSSWKAKSISFNSQLKSLLTWSHCLITAQAHSKFHLSSSLSLSQEYQSSIDLHHSYIILVSPNIMPTKTSSSYWLKPVLILLLQIILFLSIWFIISILYHLPISLYYLINILSFYPVRPTTGYII